MLQVANEDILQAENPMIKVAIYTRVSTDIQEKDGTSLETQVENCFELAKAKGYTVIAIFREVFTGSVYRERIELGKMRAMYRNGEIQGVLFNTFDRFSRNQIHLGVLISEMQHYNIFIECIKEQFDTTPTGRYMQDALAFVAEVEREKLLERTEDGRKREREGKLLGSGEPRYGYFWNEDRTAYIINEQEATIVRRIYAMALQGISIHTIASILTQEGVPSRGNRGKNGTRRGKGVWLHSTIHRILSWSGYSEGEAFVYVTHQKKVNGKRLTTLRPEEAN